MKRPVIIRARCAFGACLALCLLCGILPAAGEAPVTGNDDPALAPFDRLMTSFIKDHEVPGAALAVARHGRIIYARGFGYADVAAKQAVAPAALFRIASVSKMFTGAAILQLQGRGKLRLDDCAFPLLGIAPVAGAKVDPRLQQITISQLLHHTGGFDRGASFDPMFRASAIANALDQPSPPGPRDIIRYMVGMPLDFDPGTKEAYSNFGYCVLGRVIEKVSGLTYADYVKREILNPLGITRMRPGRSLEADRADGEVRYYSRRTKPVKSVFVEGATVPRPYGGWCLEAMDAHGGWIASAPELVQFAGSLDDPDQCPFLTPETIRGMFQRPLDTGYDTDHKPKAAYYTCGWLVRPVGKAGKANTWHNGLLDGTASLVVRRYDGLAWAVLFNTDRDPQQKSLTNLIDPMLHTAADSVKHWPAGWTFKDDKPAEGSK